MNTNKSTRALVSILHIEDSREDAELIRERLSDMDYPVHVDWATNEQEFTTLLQNRVYDLVLADYKLPSFDAPAALALTRARNSSMPFICVSGAIGEEKAVELLKHGATDYVLKDRLYKLPMSITRAVDEARSHMARKMAEEQLLETVAAYTAAKVSVDTVNAIDHGVVLIGMDGIVRYINPGLIRMMEYEKNEPEGRNILDLLPIIVKSSHLDYFTTACHRALQGELHDLRETTLVTKTAHMVHVMSRMAFIRDSSGNPSTIV
ncbi:MAG: response regulator, partial [bacterium]